MALIGRSVLKNLKFPLSEKLSKSDLEGSNEYDSLEYQARWTEISKHTIIKSPAFLDVKTK